MYNSNLTIVNQKGMKCGIKYSIAHEYKTCNDINDIIYNKLL